MTMKELSGYDVKLSKGTITAKNSDGKTAGMVRGLCKYADLRFSDQSANRAARGAIIDYNGDYLQYLYFDGKQGYYIHNTHNIDIFTEMEPERYQRLMEMLDALEKAGIEIIPVKAIL